MTIAVPRRNPYGEPTMRATRIATRSGSRPSCEIRTSATGSGRPGAGRHRPSALRGTCPRRALPIANRSARDVGRRRSEVNASLSAPVKTVCVPCSGVETDTSFRMTASRPAQRQSHTSSLVNVIATPLHEQQTPPSILPTEPPFHFALIDSGRAFCGIAGVDRVLLATDHLTRGESERLDIDVRLGICVPLGICVECAEHGSQHWVLVQVCTDVV
jgi:hypothetical protein